MGLLERALKYKKQLNETGRETLIDLIKGPAESEFSEIPNSETIGFQEIDKYQLPDETISIEIKPEELTIHQDIDENKFIPSTERLASTEEIKLSDSGDDFLLDADEDAFQEEDIVLWEENKPVGTVTTDNTVKQELNFETDLQSSGDIEDDESVEHEDSTEPGDSYQIPEFNDYAVLYEMLKEFTISDSIDEIYESVIFSIMGQLGVSSVSVISPSEENNDKWIITHSNGIKIPEAEISWEVSSGILNILVNYKGVIDIEDLKNDISLRDDYYRFISANARLVTPVIYSEHLHGIILVGEKIDSADFTAVEIDFLHSLSEAASYAIKAKEMYEKADTELLGLRIEKEILSDVEMFQNSLLSVGSIHELEDFIRRNFYSLGIEIYSIFLEEEITGDYYPAYFENDDNLGLSDSGFRIRKDNRLAAFLLNKKSSIILDNFIESSVIVETFGRERVSNMDIFIAYPFIISGKLSGFIIIYRINSDVEITDVDIRLQRIVRFIFPYIYRLIELDPDKNKYNDLTGTFYFRIENEISRAGDMNMPLALISLSVKNYKRFYDRFGKIEMNRMFITISDIIKERLSIGDFSARIDRNKFIIVLPGKDKKYSATFSSILKNEISNRFNTTEFKLLVSFISAVFPEDGSDIFSLLETID